MTKLSTQVLNEKTSELAALLYFWWNVQRIYSKYKLTFYYRNDKITTTDIVRLT